MLPFIRVTHTGLLSDGRPNNHSVLIGDLRYVGADQQFRKATVYVPIGGFVDLPISTDVVFSYEKGDIAQHVAVGVLSATVNGLVTSVFGRTGDVVAVSGDYNSDQVTNVSGVPGVTVSDALDNLVEEAPIDGNTYARKDAAWVVVTGTGGTEWRVEGTGTGTVTLMSFVYANNEGPDEFEVRALIYRDGNLGQAGVMEILAYASRGAGSLASGWVLRRADNVPGSQDLHLTTTGADTLNVNILCGVVTINYRVIIRRRTWSDFAP